MDGVCAALLVCAVGDWLCLGLIVLGGCSPGLHKENSFFVVVVEIGGALSTFNVSSQCCNGYC